MIRSFRLQLALRFTATMALGAVIITVLSLLTLRTVLDSEIDGSLVSVASIQAASVTDSPTGEMDFHEWELTPTEADSLQDLIRYAQIWDASGTSLQRSRYLTEDLPLDTEALARAAREELVWREADFQGVPVRSLYYPLERYGELHAHHVLQVGAPLAARNAMLRQVGLFLSLVSAVVVAGSFGGSLWLGGRALRPVREIIDQAEDIEARSLPKGITAYAEAAEYERLVQVLNSMLTRLQSAFESQKRFTADASHELRSPLTAMRGEMELALRRERDPEEYRRVLGSALEEVERLSRTTENLLTLARSDAGAVKAHRAPMELGALVRETVGRLSGQAAERGVSVEVAVEGDDGLAADADLMGRAVWNLVDNAIRYSPEGGTVEVRVAGSGSAVDLEVLDEGPGLGDDPESVFERFYRGDESRSALAGDGGTGLGLAIVRAIAEVHGGRVQAENRQAGGARLFLRLPSTSGGGMNT